MNDLFKAGAVIDDFQAFQHLVKGNGAIVRTGSKGVSGTHNLKEFLGTIYADAKQYGFDITDYNLRITKHPAVDGIYEITYDLPKIDGKGNPILSNGNITVKPANTPKTVFDPRIFTNNEIYTMGRKALEANISAGTLTPAGTLEVNRIAANGLKFVGYWDPATNTWTSIYPVL